MEEKVLRIKPNLAVEPNKRDKKILINSKVSGEKNSPIKTLTNREFSNALEA